ncbi:cation-transporting P-type ATPase [Nitrosomonas sp. Nm166]|uniref:cation-transporting P-type ATPase n=1 Tax=Nitrosomonas sp. Nm166 TaxID=1881054 RepID=UPI0008F1A24B|nr:cation-transporting P-type ATPase [Nitrosomonas sp. Nm166]SFF02386.1 ATPase, P-type (transporting), HAD superfamily, subfamily IC [Nitrosomonas sp. Nm166]
MQQFRKESVQTLWHYIPINQVLEQLNTTSAGLNDLEAEARLKIHGFNRLPEPPKRSIMIRFLWQFHHILIYVLLGSAVVTATLAHWIDTLVILAVVLINAIIGFVQEGKAEKSMDAIRQMLTPHTSVLRNGERHSITGDKLVPGDIVILEAGDKVPADLRLLKTHGLQIQEAILTGESVPAQKQIESVAADAPLGDRHCMAFSGTVVTAGQGKGVVIATGVSTEIGRISELLSEVETLTTPLIKQMQIFAQWLTIFILLVAMLLLAYGYFVGHHEFTEMFMAVVGLSVAAIPEGLPAVLTITLAIGVQAMAQRNAIVRRLPAIETIGSVSVICTDKTGTLTRNEMMVSSVLTHQHLFTLQGAGYEPQGALLLENAEVFPSEYTVLKELARAAVLCNDASLHNHTGAWVVEGDPMEGALLAFACKIGIEVPKEQAIWLRTDVIPFDAKHRFMATLNHDHEHHACVFIKGAPEQILAMCLQQSMSSGTEPLNKTYWQEKADCIASLGQRVLAFAAKPVEPEHAILEYSNVESGFILLGMTGMIDPPRTEAIAAVAECHAAGIQVKMITGDHAKTAAAIAEQINLQNPITVLTGADIDRMDDTSLKAAVLECDVFARTHPEHKLRLVTALQSHNMSVAMTGDGVNDAPALKRADVGIAMGRKGTEAAKEAAEIVLTDDNFASIVNAVREGRTVYDNIKKVISWTLPTNAGEAITIIVALLFGMTLPITPLQILWINLITAATLGIALAFEPTEENTMQRPPRARGESLLSGELVWQILLVSILFFCGIYGIYTYAIEQGYSIELARTLAVNTVLVLEIFYLFFIRNIYGTSLTWKAIRGTKVVWLTILIITTAQLSITYLPPLQVIFSTAAVPFLDGALVIGIGIALFAIIETEKQIRLRLKNLKL